MFVRLEVEPEVGSISTIYVLEKLRPVAEREGFKHRYEANILSFDIPPAMAVRASRVSHQSQ
jgi:hypothetical protein